MVPCAPLQERAAPDDFAELLAPTSRASRPGTFLAQVLVSETRRFPSEVVGVPASETSAARRGRVGLGVVAEAFAQRPAAQDATQGAPTASAELAATLAPTLHLALVAPSPTAAGVASPVVLRAIAGTALSASTAVVRALLVTFAQSFARGVALLA